MKNNHGTTETHPSYAMIGINRVSGSGRLFGSPLPNHHSFIRISVKRADVTHDLSYDRYHAHGRELITVEMSNAQFAEMITSLNHGDGVPCTLDRFDGKAVERKEDIVPEHQKVVDGFKERLGDFTKGVHDLVGSVAARLKDKKPLLQKEREEILSALRMVAMEVESNIPFVLTQFAESADRVVVSAKAEIHATQLRVGQPTAEISQIKESATATLLPARDRQGSRHE